MIYPSDGKLPRNLAGYGCWLQVLHRGEWHTTCALRPMDARSLLRFLESHPSVLGLRLSIERV